MKAWILFSMIFKTPVEAQKYVKVLDIYGDVRNHLKITEIKVVKTIKGKFVIKYTGKIVPALGDEDD